MVHRGESGGRSERQVGTLAPRPAQRVTGLGSGHWSPPPDGAASLVVLAHVAEGLRESPLAWGSLPPAAAKGKHPPHLSITTAPRSQRVPDHVTLASLPACLGLCCFLSQSGMAGMMVSVIRMRCPEPGLTSVTTWVYSCLTAQPGRCPVSFVHPSVARGPGQGGRNQPDPPGCVGAGGPFAEGTDLCHLFQ